MAEENAEFLALIQSAEESQREMQKIQKKLIAMIVSGESPAADLRVDMTGMYAVTVVAVDDSLLKKDKAILEESILAAVNDGAKKVETALADAIAGMKQIQMPKGYEE
jgi:DNA-binding YbaB/EbfC family protein